MKSKIFILFLLIEICFSNANFAQYTIKKSISEKKVAGTTYVIESHDKFGYIKNKYRTTKELIKKNKKQCEGNFLSDSDYEFIESQKVAVKSVIPQEKIIKLASSKSNYFALRYVCNRLGEIKAVSFMNIDTSIITLEEIQLIEELLLKLKIKINNSGCPETEYFYFSTRIRYKDLMY